MRRNLCLIGLAATLTLGLVPTAASAENYHYQFRGNSAYASFASSDGCVVTWTDVSLYESRYHTPPGPPQQSAPGLGVYVISYDYCQYRYLNEIYSFAELPAGSFSFGGGLQSAQVNATLEAYDYATGSTVPVTINVTWDGVGEASQSSSHNRWSSPNYKAMWRSKGTVRDASASGSVVVGTVNMTPDPSVWANLSSAQSGSITIYRF